MTTETMDALDSESGRKNPARFASGAILACQSDDRLVELVREGHERAFEAIVGRYRAMLVRFCGGILPASRAEDAVQLAFLNAHTALRTSDDPVQLKPWLFAITRNAALNMLRQNGWNYEQIPDDFDGVMRPDQAVEQKIELQATVAAVNELPERQRRALVMRELEGRSYEEIAVALAAGDGAVRQLLNRARVTLRSIATAVMPPPLVARAATSLPPSDGRRVAEVLGSFGAAGMVKVGASAVVAGSLVVGAVEGPLPISHHQSAKPPAVVRAADHVRRPAPPTAATPSLISAGGDSRGASKHSVADDHGGARGHRGGSDDHGGRSGSDRGSGSDDRSGSDHRSGSDDRSGSSGRSGSDDRDSRSGPSSGSDDSRSGSSGGSDSGSGDGSDSSGHGSDDVTTTLLGGDDSSSGSGSGTSGSDTSGSDSSGSGSSGSGTSGSGSSDSLSGGSGTSGSGSLDRLSGSGTSGSGAGDAVSDDSPH